MRTEIDSMSSGELRHLLVNEIHNLIIYLDAGMPFEYLSDERSYIRSIYLKLDKKEREDFDAIFGKNSLLKTINDLAIKVENKPV